MTTTERTTPEPTAQELDSGALKEMLVNTETAILSTNEKINALETRIGQHHEKQAELADQLAEQERTLNGLVGQLKEVQSRHIQARTAESVAAGTAAEAATAAHVELIRAELATLQTQLEAAQKQNADAEALSSKEQAAVGEALAKDESELLSLRQQAQLLKKSREQTHSALGQAVFREFEEKFKELRGHEYALETVLADTRAPIQQLQFHIPQLLGEWPALAEKAQRLYGVAPEKSETTRLLETYLAFLEELAALADKRTKYSAEVGGPDEYEMTRLLTISEIDARTILGRDISQGMPSGNGYALVSERMRAVQKRLQEHEVAQKRAWEAKQRGTWRKQQ